MSKDSGSPRTLLYSRAMLIALVVCFFSLEITEYFHNAPLHPPTPIILTFVIVLVCAWLGGLTGGLIAVALVGTWTAFRFAPFRDAPWTWETLSDIGLLVIAGVAMTLIISTFRNIRRQAASTMKKLKKSELQFRQLFENSPVAIGMGRPGEKKFVNQATLRLFGLNNLDEFHSLDTLNLIAPEFRDELRATAWKLHQGEAQAGTYEVLGLRRDGKPFPLQLLVSLIDLEDGPAVLVYLHDISRRKQAEEEIMRLNRDLQRRVEEFSTLIDVLPVGIGLATDAQCQSISINPCFAQALDIDPSANFSMTVPLGERATPFNIIRDGRVVEGEDLPMQRAAASGREVRDEEMDIVHRDGRVVNLLVNATPLFDEAGKVRGCVGAFLDITAHKKAEDALRSSEARLRRIFAASPIGMGLVDVWDNVQYANGAMLNLLGYTPQDLEQGAINWDKLTPPGYHCLDERALKESAATGFCIPFEKECIRKDGRRINILSGLAMIDGTSEYVAFMLDITERKHVEAERNRLIQQLEQERANLETIINEIPVGLIIAEAPTGNILRSNDQIRTIFHRAHFPSGINELQETCLGYHDDGLGYAVQDWPLLRALTTGTVVTNEEIQIPRPDGTWGTIIVNARPVRDRAGAITSSVAIVHDISENKRVEEELRQSNDNINDILESISDMFVAFDHQLHYIYVNRRAEEFLEKTSEQLIGFHLSHVFPGIEQTEYFQALHRAAEEKVTLTLEEGDASRTGWLEYNIYPSHRGISVYFRDVTQRKRAEQTLRFLSEASNALATSLDYETTLQNVARLVVPQLADCCLIDLVNEDESTRLVAAVHADPSKAELMQALQCYPLRPPVGDFIAQILEQGQPQIEPEITDELLQGIACGPEHLALLRNLGPKSWMIVPLIARDRTIGAIFLWSMDENRRYQLRDLPLAVGIAQRAALAVDNARLFQKIQEADRRKDEFLAMLAHELRNPLAPIHTAVELIRRRLGNDPQFQQEISTLQRQTLHMSRLIDDLLDVSRITQGRIELRRARVDLTEIVRHAIDSARPFIASRGHILNAELPMSPVWLVADATRLEQVIVNLLNNATKYMDTGGAIWLSLDRDQDPADQEQAVLRLRDSGIGIPADILPRIFDVFVQADRSLDRTQGGLGLGLTLVHRLVDMHGGTVQAFSEGSGHGSEFVIHLPIGDNAEEPPAEPIATLARDSDEPECSLKILVVDDHPDSAYALGELLELWGHQTRVALDGQAALETAQAYRPDVVLLDIGLPGINGYEVARCLRSDPAFEDLLLIALTGYGQEEDRRKTAAVGFDYHFTKPVDLTILEQLMSQPPRRQGDRKFSEESIPAAEL